MKFSKAATLSRTHRLEFWVADGKSRLHHAEDSTRQPAVDTLVCLDGDYHRVAARKIKDGICILYLRKTRVRERRLLGGAP